MHTYTVELKFMVENIQSTILPNVNLPFAYKTLQKSPRTVKRSALGSFELLLPIGYRFDPVNRHIYRHTHIFVGFWDQFDNYSRSLKYQQSNWSGRQISGGRFSVQ